MLNVRSDVDEFHRANLIKTLQLSISDFLKVKIGLEVVSTASPLPDSLIVVES